MGCCKTEYFQCEGGVNLGSYPSCNMLILPMVAEVAGTFTAKYKFNHAHKEQSFDLAIGDKLKLDLRVMNENYQYCFSIYDPDGNLMTFDIKINTSNPCDTENLETKCFWNFFIETHLSKKELYVAVDEILCDI